MYQFFNVITILSELDTFKMPLDKYTTIPKIFSFILEINICNIYPKTYGWVCFASIAKDLSRYNTTNITIDTQFFSVGQLLFIYILSKTHINLVHSPRIHPRANKKFKKKTFNNFYLNQNVPT